jgi:SAM-dependent methyltransferase
VTGGATAADAWAAALGEWAIPQEILDAAPETPWSFPRALFAWTPERNAAAESDAGSPMPTSRQRALEALPEGGSVLDVGVGGGRASLPLAPPAGLVVGVDSSEELLAAFGQAAQHVGVDYRAVLGTWPDVAGQVGPADVVVCHHVAYNVADLAPFARALTDHARNRVVMELTATHPTSNLNPAWRALHGLERPTRPTADDAVAVLEEMGLRVIAEPNQRVVTPSGRDRAEVVAFARRRLCVGPERDAEVERLLGPEFERPLRDVVTVWWDGQAR